MPSVALRRLKSQQGGSSVDIVGFVGEWKDGKPWNGSGKYTNPANKAVFEGHIRRGVPFSGKGTWISSGGSTFTGTIEDGWPVSGSGAIPLSSNLYDGAWGADGHGYGTIEHLGSAKGVIWDGDWRAFDRAMDPEQLPFKGSGEFITGDGLRCRGTWVDGEVVDGDGSWRSQRSGLLYEGKMGPSPGSGTGTITSKSSHGRELLFFGEWRGGIPYHGTGEICLDETTFKGEWKQAERFYKGRKFQGDMVQAVERHIRARQAAQALEVEKHRARTSKVRTLPTLDPDRAAAVDDATAGSSSAISSGSSERGDERRKRLKEKRQQRLQERAAAVAAGPARTKSSKTAAAAAVATAAPTPESQSQTEATLTAASGAAADGSGGSGGSGDGQTQEQQRRQLSIGLAILAKTKGKAGRDPPPPQQSRSGGGGGSADSLSWTCANCSRENTVPLPATAATCATCGLSDAAVLEAHQRMKSNVQAMLSKSHRMRSRRDQEAAAAAAAAASGVGSALEKAILKVQSEDSFRPLASGEMNKAGGRDKTGGKGKSQGKSVKDSAGSTKTIGSSAKGADTTTKQKQKGKRTDLSEPDPEPEPKPKEEAASRAAEGKKQTATKRSSSSSKSGRKKQT